MSDDGHETELWVDVETKAKGMGWVPKEKFRGDPARWVDAETFVDRGEQVLPIVNARVKTLESEKEALSAKLAAAETAIAESREAIEELKAYNSAQALGTVKAQKKELLRQLTEAKREDNVDLEVELQDQLSEVNEALKEAEAAPPPKPKVKSNGKEADDDVPDPRKDPQFVAWQSDNEWFGEDEERTAIAGVIGRKLRNDPEHRNKVGRAFLDLVTERVEEWFAERGERKADKVSGGAPSGGGGRRSAKGYDSLPPDAKEACEKQAKRLVGPNRAYKTNEEWRKAYAARYHEQE